MNRLFRILFGLFVAVHIFFLFRYSTPLPCNAASHRIYEVLAADKVIGPFILIGVSVQGEEEFISSFVERIAPLIQQDKGYNGCYQIALFGIPDEDKRFWNDQ